MNARSSMPVHVPYCCYLSEETPLVPEDCSPQTSVSGCFFFIFPLAVDITFLHEAASFLPEHPGPSLHPIHGSLNFSLEWKPCDSGAAAPLPQSSAQRHPRISLLPYRLRLLAPEDNASNPGSLDSQLPPKLSASFP